MIRDIPSTTLHQIMTRVIPAYPVTTTDSVPEPDVKVVRGRLSDFATRHPAASDLALVVEVADTSLQQDRTIKHRIYARAKVPIYWIVNLIHDVVEVHTEPTSSPNRTTSRGIFRRPENSSMTAKKSRTLKWRTSYYEVIGYWSAFAHCPHITPTADEPSPDFASRVALF
jgi:hypothetical protein